MRWSLLLAAMALPAFAQESPPGEAPPESPPAEAPAAAEPAAAEAIPVPEAGKDEKAGASAPAPAGSVELDAIEVTAQRRTQRLVDVPLAVSAMTRDEIQSRNISRLDDLNSLAPGLQVSRSPADTTISQLTIRGSSQINPALYWDPAVGVYLDGVYIGKAQGSIFDIVDLAGVEVLRGPQGTLYGRNTIAGTINFLTREPTGIFSGTGAVELGNYGRTLYRAAVDLPRVGPLSVALGARSEQRDPWVETTPTSPADGLNNRDNQGAHLAGHFFQIS